MTTPAKPAGARPSTAAPKTVKTRIAVPMISAARPTRLPALALTETAPRPSVAGLFPLRMTSVRPAPMNAPTSCAAM
jgi:hypothetical protein